MPIYWYDHPFIGMQMARCESFVRHMRKLADEFPKRIAYPSIWTLRGLMTLLSRRARGIYYNGPMVGQSCDSLVGMVRMGTVGHCEHLARQRKEILVWILVLGRGRRTDKQRKFYKTKIHLSISKTSWDLWGLEWETSSQLS